MQWLVQVALRAYPSTSAIWQPGAPFLQSSRKVSLQLILADTGRIMQDEGRSHLIAAHHPEARMRSADIGSNVPGAPALAQRLTHINSHNASASGHRTLEELLTALRKVWRCTIPLEVWGVGRSLMPLGSHHLCTSQIQHRTLAGFECPCSKPQQMPFPKTCYPATGGGSAEAWSPGETQDALLPPGRRRHTSHVEVRKWQATKHCTCKCLPGGLMVLPHNLLH